MNDTTPPPGSPDPGTRGAPGANTGTNPGAERRSDRFYRWLRGLGIVRGRERWFAGVAGGIATKAGIDPLIVRGIFVVLAILGGPGVLLYLAGWLLLPDDTGRIHLEELFRGRASAGVIVTVVILGALILLPLMISGLGGLFAGNFLWGWGPAALLPSWVHTVMAVIWWAVLLPALIIWLIVWIGRGGLGRTSSRPAEPAPAAASAAASESFTEAAGPESGWGERVSARAAEWGEQAGAWGEKVGEQADAWGQKVGEQADAWGKSVGEKAQAFGERERERYEARRLGAAHVVLTLAAALIAAGVAAVWALSSNAIPDSPVPGDGGAAILAAMIAALAMCAVSLIIAGIRGRNSGWVGFFAFCGVVALLFTAVMPWGSRFQMFGPATVAVTDLDGSPAGLTVLAGNASIDLTELEEPQDFALWVIAGNATVELPEDLPAVVEVVVVAGNIREIRGGEAGRLSGPFLGRTTGANLDGADPNDISRITVHMVAGNVRIEGANASPGLSERFASAASRDDGASPATEAAPAYDRPTQEHAS